MDNGCYVGVLLLDFSRAFDTVSHQGLLNELTNIGCGPKTVSWFSSYLSDRQQRTKHHSETTPWQTVTRGVPQGSGLSPILFNIYVRELPACCTSEIYQFADDTTASESDQKLEIICDKLTNTFNAVEEYCKSRELIINTAKTQLIILKPAGKTIPDDVQLCLNGITLKPEKTVKLLGVTIDQHLTFGPHVKETVTRCQGTLGVLARSVPYMTTELLKLMYTGIIRSSLEYCSALLLPVANSHKKKLEIVEKKAARIILRQPRDAHAEPLLKELHLEPLDERREAHAMKVINSSLQGNCHPALKNMFTVLPDGSLEVLDTRTAIGKRRFGIVGAKLFTKKQNIQL